MYIYQLILACNNRQIKLEHIETLKRFKDNISNVFL